jgi:hypothetical protein
MKMKNRKDGAGTTKGKEWRPLDACRELHRVLPGKTAQIAKFLDLPEAVKTILTNHVASL